MAIQIEAEPANGRTIVHDALARQLHRAENIPALSGAPQTGAPLPLYVITPIEASRTNPLGMARRVGWQYPVVGGNAPGLACLLEKPSGLEFAGLSFGPLAARLLDAATLVEDSLASLPEIFVPRLLEMPALKMCVLWLYGEGGSNFYVALEHGQRVDAPPLQIERSIQPRIDVALARLRAQANASAKAEKARRVTEAGRKRAQVFGLLALLLTLVAVQVAFATRYVGALGTDALAAWIIDLVLVTGAFAALGHGFTGNWFGVLVDGRNKMSMSRLQLVLWTILFVTTFLVAYVWNVGHDKNLAEALSLTVPSAVWLLMGMSGVSAAGSPAILSAKPAAAPSSPPSAPTDPAKFVDGVVVKRQPGEAPRWSDIILGDEVGNCEAIDVGKLQLLFLTLAAIVGYGYVIAQTLVAAKGGPVLKLPAMDDGFLTLIGASHVTYLGYKGVSHSY